MASHFYLFLLFPCWLYIHIRVNAASNFAMFLFKGFYILPNQDKDMAIDRATFIIRYIADFF